MLESELRQALEVHLNGMAGVPPIDFENVGLGQDNRVYLSSMLFPAEDITVGMEQGGSDVFAGVYQVMVHVPKGTGRSIYTDEVNKVRVRFVRGTKIGAGTTTVIIHKVWTNSSLSDENYFKIPISIRYRAL